MSKLIKSRRTLPYRVLGCCQAHLYGGLLMSLGGGAVFAQESPQTATKISLNDALTSAQATSSPLLAAQARLDVADARLRGAGVRLAPQLSVAHAFGKDTAGFDEDLILSQTFELGKRSPKIRSASALRSAALSDRTGSGTDLRFSVESAYFDALRTQSELELAQNSLQSAQTFDQAAQDQLTAGDVPRANVVRSGIEVERAKQALADAQTERDNRFATLASLIGQPTAQPLELADTLQFQPADYDEAVLQQTALQQRADLAGARALALSKTADLAVAHSQGRPDAFVELRRAAITSYSGVPNGQSLRFGFVMPLGDFGTKRSAVAEAGAAKRESEATLQEALRVARLDVQTSLTTYRSAMRNVQSFQNGRLDRAKELLDMAQIGYQHGANSYLELLDAQNVYRAEQTDYARALAGWNTARAALEHAVGGKLP